MWDRRFRLSVGTKGGNANPGKSSNFDRLGPVIPLRIVYLHKRGQRK